MTLERAIEILNPEHREHYDSIETVNEACRMGMEALEKQLCEKSKQYRAFSMQDVKDSDEMIFVADCEFKGIFAYWLYYMCPLHPRKFEIIMTKLMEIIERTFNEGTASLKMISIAYKDVHNWIETIVKSIPDILELNLTTNEFKAGVTLETREETDTVVLTSRYSTIPDGEDFVDIGALVQNVTYSICKEAAEL